MRAGTITSPAGVFSRRSRLIKDLIENHSKELGINRRAITDQEVLERCIFLMINEGANILGEKNCSSSGATST